MKVGRCFGLNARFVKSRHAQIRQIERSSQRQLRQNQEQAANRKLVKKDEIQQSVVDSCVWSQLNTGSKGRRVQYACQDTLLPAWNCVSGVDCYTHAPGPISDIGTNRRRDVPRSARPIPEMAC